MRVVLADVEGTYGFVHKDTVVGGYGARMTGFSGVTRLACALRRRFNDVPSITMAYLAAILADAGHEVAFTRGAPVAGDVAIVLSSLVDHRNEARWADAARARGARVGFVGLAASKLPELFEPHADFVVDGEPEEAVSRLARGELLTGRVRSRETAHLDALPFPRWDLLDVSGRRGLASLWTRPLGGLPLLASRGCPEFCTYCPHRILAGYRSRSVRSVVDEIGYLCERAKHPFVIFRDPLFSEDRERCLAIADEILARGLRLHFECETRLDRLDEELLERLQRAGLRAIEFGVESLSPQALRKVGRRPIPEEQQRRVIAACKRLGIRTVGFYVLGLPSDSWDSIAATIDYSISLGSTLAQFKLLTPYPGTPLWRQLGPLVYERDWERFDGFTPTFSHPELSAGELRFLLAAAYGRFYLRASCLANNLRVERQPLRSLAERADRWLRRWHAESETLRMSRAVEC